MTDDINRVTAIAPPAVAVTVPLVGVTIFDWSLVSVILFYWIEAGVTTLRLTVEATFAGRPNSDVGRVVLPPFAALREKHGGIELPGSLPPLYPRSIPAALDDSLTSALVWFATGIALSGLGVSSVLLGSTAGLAVGAGAVVLGQIATLLSHLRWQSFEDRSPGAVAGPQRVVGQVVLLLVVLIALAGRDGSLTGARGLVFTAVVFGRGAVSVVDRLGVTDRVLPAALRPEQQVSEAVPAVSRNVAQTASVVFRPSRWSTVSAQLLVSPFRTLGSQTALFAVVSSGFAGWIVAERIGLVGAVGTVFAVAAVVFTVEQDLRYGHLEYRVSEDAVVAYDRLLETPQWRLELGAITEMNPSHGTLDRLTPLTLGKLWVETTDDSQVLVGLDDPEAVREEIDERQVRTD